MSIMPSWKPSALLVVTTAAPRYACAFADGVDLLTMPGNTPG